MLTRSNILDRFPVNKEGIITSPGKFEAEPIWAPYFWYLVQSGGADDTHEFRGVIKHEFLVDTDDEEEFPELKGIARVFIWEDYNGSVHTETIEHGEEEE